MKASTGGNLFHNLSLGSEASADSPNVSLQPLDRTFTSDGPTVKGILSSSNDSAGKNNIVQSTIQLLASESQIKLEEKQDTKSPEINNKDDANVSSAKVGGNKDAALKNSNKINETGTGERSVQSVASAFVVCFHGWCYNCTFLRTESKIRKEDKLRINHLKVMARTPWHLSMTYHL